MITVHPTRTNLLLLKEKGRSVSNSVGILKARRQALIQEFLRTTRPFLNSRETIRHLYGQALQELAFSLGHEGDDAVAALASAAQRELGAEVIEQSIWGLRYREIIVSESPERLPDGRGYDFLSTTPHLEEAIHFFEKVLESMLELAAFENKLKRLSAEIIAILRKIRVLEERIIPQIRQQVRIIAQHISERERESHYRLKRFKAAKGKPGAVASPHSPSKS